MAISKGRKRTNLTLDVDLIGVAQALGVNLSQAAEEGVRNAVVRTQAERWKAENGPALESSNAYVAASGLPLRRHRRF